MFSGRCWKRPPRPSGRASRRRGAAASKVHHLPFYIFVQGMRADWHAKLQTDKACKLTCRSFRGKANEADSPVRGRLRERLGRRGLTSTSVAVMFTDPAPLLFPSQTRKYRPRTFWYPYFWLLWPAGSEQLKQRGVGDINNTSQDSTAQRDSITPGKRRSTWGTSTSTVVLVLYHVMK